MAGDRSRVRRRLASECLALARDTSDLQIRSSLLDMAQKWLDLAELCEHDAWNRSLRRRAIQSAIGKELQFLYGLPQPLPHRFLALLVQMNAEQDGDGAADS
jgi:hypothetical protein